MLFGNQDCIIPEGAEITEDLIVELIEVADEKSESDLPCSINLLEELLEKAKERKYHLRVIWIYNRLGRFFKKTRFPFSIS